MLEQNEFYHIYNRGNDKQKIFFERDNYLFFLKKLKVLNYYTSILSWCLMPNHFHILIYVSDKDENHKINVKLGTILSSYSQAINLRLNRTGSLFQQRTKFKKITSPEYALVCFNYIHQNPMKAGIVNLMEDYEFSSFRDYAGFRSGQLVDKQKAAQFLNLPESAKEIFDLSYKIIPDNKIIRLF